MRLILLVLAATVCAVSPLSAQTQTQASDTLRLLVSNGAVMRANGYSILVQYHEDGTYTGRVETVEFAGEWRIDGTRLCTASRMSPTQTCTEYPPGKRPGEAFDVQSPTLGEVNVRINE